MSATAPAPNLMSSAGSNLVAQAPSTTAPAPSTSESTLDALTASLASMVAAGFSSTGAHGEPETMPTGKTDSSQVAASNPYLAFQPAYTYSMPTQMLIYGVVLTLLTVLLVHLIFTARYHYPLAKLNFGLLLTSVVVTEALVCVVIAVVNTALLDKSRGSPFMLEYAEVPAPSDAWSQGTLIGWYMSQAVITLLTHATHIQFLTLLFPSSLERRLILLFFVPLAALSSALYFTAFFNDPDFVDLGDAIRNTANSTLTLLYTAGLILWGGAVNRQRAWDWDGGTAGFGIMAILLAILGTSTNFVEVKEDRLHWLPWIVWTTLLWQSWTGFWWWVGAGMWSGEAEDLEKREEKQRRREEKRLRRRERRLRLLTLHSGGGGSEEGKATSTSNRFGSGAAALLSSGASLIPRRLTVRRTHSGRTATTSNAAEPAIELETMGGDLSPRPDGDPVAASPTPSGRRRRPPMVADDVSTSSVPSSSTSPTQIPFIGWMLKPAFVRRFVGRLSAAHNAAAKAQAREAEGVEETQDVKQWGLRAMMRRVERARQGDRLSADEGEELSEGEEQEIEEALAESRRERRSRQAQMTPAKSPDRRASLRTPSRTPARAEPGVGGDEWVDDSDSDLPDEGDVGAASPAGRDDANQPDGLRRRRPSLVALDRTASPGYGDPPVPRRRRPTLASPRSEDATPTAAAPLPSPAPDGEGELGMEGQSGWAWRGGLARARLRDVTSYD